MSITPRQRRFGVMLTAAAALAGCVLLGWRAPQQMLLSWLAAWLFVLGLTLGSVPLLLITPLTGGRWSGDLLPPLLASLRVLPLVLFLLLPLLFGMRWLFPWMHPASLQDPDFDRQLWYLNAPFFVARTILCALLWWGMSWMLRRRLRGSGEAAVSVRFAAIALIVYALSISVAAVDWIGSLVPAWHSSTLGLIVGTGQLLGAAALAVFCTNTRNAVALLPARRRDTGNLLLMLVLAWSYLVFMDYLTAWIADLPAETVWYLPRLHSSWHWLGAVLIALALALPFALLLSRRAKQQRRWMMTVAAMLVLAQMGFAAWLVWPSFRPGGFSLHWSDALAWIGVVGLCWSVFDLRLTQERMLQPEER